MRLDKFISRRRVIDLKSSDLKGALDELLTVSLARFKDLKKKPLLDALLKREDTMTTYLGNGVALPHIRIKMPRQYIFAVGRSESGIIYDGSFKDDEKVHLVLLLIAGEDERNYLQMLASIARLVKDKEFVDELVAAPTIDALYERLFLGVGGVVTKPVQVQKSRVNRLIFRQAEKVANGTNCSAVVVFGDTLTSSMELTKWLPKFRTILVARTASDMTIDKEDISTIQVRSFFRHRLSQLRSSVLVGLTRGLIRFTDRLCCVGGIPGSNQFDTIVVVDVEKEFQVLFHEQADILPPDVKPEVFERVLGISTELAVEGREGRPVGSIFVIGDTEKVGTMTKPLVLNPFFGYKEEDRNIMNPFMDETIKEFSCMDGAFVVRGDGVVMAAGSLLHAPDYYHSLPSGLGARHAAAAAISLAANCISIVISSSTGQVTLFRRGVRLPLIEKSNTGNY